MTDPNVEAASITEEAAPTEDTAKRKGRPRPEDTIKRDEQVLKLIAESGDNGVTRTQLAETLELEGNTVYLSLFRLKQDGTIVRSRNGGDHVWKTVVAEPTSE